MKKKEQLSRRLHQKVKVPRRNPGSLRPVNRLTCVVASQRCTNLLSLEDAAYIAGLIDGEGTITLTRIHSNENRRLVVSIANTERQLLDFVLDRTGAGKITRKRTTSERHTPSFCYYLTSRQALSLLEQVGPFLRSYKLNRARLALDLYLTVTPRNGKYSAECLATRRKFEIEFLSLTAGSQSAR